MIRRVRFIASHRLCKPAFHHLSNFMHAKVARVRHLIARQKVAERTEGVSTVYNVNLVVVCPETDGASKILGNLGTR